MIGLLAWLYLQAELTVYAVEVNVVRAYRLWPRSIAPPPYTEQDRRAYQLYAEVTRRGEGMTSSWIVAAPEVRTIARGIKLTRTHRTWSSAARASAGCPPSPGSPARACG